MEKLVNMDGITVRDLKRLIRDWPEEREDGTLTEVWIGEGHGKCVSNACTMIYPLNLDRTSADIILAP